jgi:RNA polymerase sigma factor (sigma-70 family)
MAGSPIHTKEAERVASEPGDKAAVVERLSRTFRAPLARFFEKRIGRHAEVDDLVQEVFLHLARSGRVDAVEQPEAYLFKTAANLLLDRERRLKARESRAHEPYEEGAHGGAHVALSPERELLGSQAIEQLVAALYELPARAREVWALYHLEDLSHAQIATRLGISVSTIEKHMSRAMAHLLKRLEHSA